MLSLKRVIPRLFKFKSPLNLIKVKPLYKGILLALLKVKSFILF
jgi:hypothetical protein